MSSDSDELLALAQEAGQLGVFEWQVQSGAMQASPKLLALYGLEAFDHRYESWLGTIFREDVPRIVDLIDTAFAARSRDLHAEFRIVRRADGALRWIESRAIAFYDADGRAVRVVGVNADVTDRKRSLVQLHAFTETLEERVKERTLQLETENEARRKAEEQLRQAQKMDAVGQLTGGVAHDFNNLLTIILGGLNIIGRQVSRMEQSAPLARIARAREMAVEGVQRAATLTHRLLAFSRQQPLDPKPIDGNALVAGMSGMLRRALGEAIALETVLAAGLWPTFADGNQLESALLNLALNARDATPDGGKVTIETANCMLDEAYVSQLSEPVSPGQYVMLAVADTGQGMDKATLERAFEPFFTTKAIGKGTGLGLSQVYGFARQSDGHVKIYTEPGRGTTVKLYLRRHYGADEAKPVQARPKRVEGAIGDECILLVEDDDALRGFAADILTELGYRVLSASTGPAGLEIVRCEPVDLLFTDIVMPGGMNGRQLADDAQRLRPSMKVLFTTGYTRNAIVHHGRLDPDVRLIAKPYAFEELAAKVRTVLDEPL